MLQVCIDAIPSRNFTTLRVIRELEMRYPNEIKSLQGYSERNCRSVIGKAKKRFSTETGKLKQISPAYVSPALWEKK